MWQFAAAALAPMVAGALMPRARAPRAPRPTQLPDRSMYVDQMMGNAFNPDSEMYRLAADQLAGQINSQMAARGLGRSSIADNRLSSSLGNLSNQWMQDALQNQMAALGSVGQMDMGRAQLQQGNEQQAYQHAMQMYNQDMANRQGLIGGIGNLSGALAGQWNQNRMMDQLGQMTQGRQDAFTQVAQPAHTPRLQPIRSQYMGDIGL